MTINRTHLAGLELARKELGEHGSELKAHADYHLAPLIAQAQAAPEAEPVCWVNDQQLLLCIKSPREDQPNNPMMHGLSRNIAGGALRTGYCNTPLYTAPPATGVNDVIVPRKLLRVACSGGNEAWQALEELRALLAQAKP